MKTRVAYGEIEEIYVGVDDWEALDDFCTKHPEAIPTDCTVTEVGSFYDRNR